LEKNSRRPDARTSSSDAVAGSTCTSMPALAHHPWRGGLDAQVEGRDGDALLADRRTT
jgi:hypothetical protein